SKELLRDKVYLIFGSSSLETEIETSMLQEIVMPIRVSFGQTKQFTSSNSTGVFSKEDLSEPGGTVVLGQLPLKFSEPGPEFEMGFKELERIGDQTRNRIEIEGTACEFNDTV
ncbi:MAG: hypothetical protein O3B01_19905, partial [Planctomycetota bacterium]|nr:hypothetical protein [Planctomycetota bacterium]